MKRLFLFLSLSFILVFGLSSIYMPSTVVYALEDSIGESKTEDSDGDLFKEGKLSKEDKAVGNYIQSQRGMTGKQMAEAGKKLSPITNIAGYLVGGIVVILFAYVFVITALDLLYLTIPPIRNFLYKGGAEGTSPMMGGMPGGYGGYGGYGARGGYGAAPMMGGTQGVSAKPTQWISDEAVQCSMLLGGSQNAQMGAMGGVGAMNNMASQMPQQMPMKSVIVEYFKKRLVFMIILAICAIVLTSSVLLGTGVNLAEWFIRMIDGLNSSIPK